MSDQQNDLNLENKPDLDNEAKKELLATLEGLRGVLVSALVDEALSLSRRALAVARAELSADHAVGYQKQAYWHVVDVSISLSGIIKTKTMDDIINWARLERNGRTHHGIQQKMQRHLVGSPGPNDMEPEDVEDDQLLLLLEHTPHLIREVGQHLTSSKGRELAARVKSTMSLDGEAPCAFFCETGYKGAVEWAKKMAVNECEVPEYSIPKWDGASPGDRLERLEKLSKGMGLSFARMISTFFTRLDEFVESGHKAPPNAPIPEPSKTKLMVKFTEWKEGFLGQKLELDDPVVKWAKHWWNAISEEDYVLDVANIASNSSRDLLRF